MSSAIVMQFSAQADFGAELIEWFGHGAFSHVDSVLEDGRLLGARSDVCAGVPPGVQIRPQHYAPFSRVLRVELPAPEGVVRAYYEFVLAQVGKPYDKLGIAGFVVGRDWRDLAAWFCSELNGRGLEPDVSGYFAYRLSTPANKLTPPDLVLVCSTRVPLLLKEAA